MDAFGSLVYFYLVESSFVLDLLIAHKII